MRFFDRSTLAFLGLSFALVACGGSHKEAEVPKAPETDVASGIGSSVPDPTPTTNALTTNPPASETAKASTKDDGSDIIPPFPSAGGKKGSASPAKPARKVAKKKVAATE